MSAWPAELRATLSLVLDSGIPMSLRVGPRLRLFYNDAFVGILGDRHPAAFGLPSLDALPEVHAHFAADFVRVLAGETVVRRDEALPLRRDGAAADAYFDLGMTPYRDADGHVAGIVSTVQETTGRVLAERGRAAVEAALREREARLQQALEGADLGTWTWDPAADVAVADERTRRILGIGGDEPPNLRRMLAEVVVAEDRGLFAERVAAGVDPAGDGIFECECRLVRAGDGDETWVRLTGKTRFAGEGADRRPVLMIGTMQDIGARRRIDVAIREHQVRQTFLLQLGDLIRGLDAPAAIAAAATKALAAHLGVARVIYAEVDADGSVARMLAEQGDGTLPPLPVRMPLTSFGPVPVERWRAGRSSRSDDVAADPREGIAESRDAYAAYGIAATICSPLLRGDRLAAIVAAHASAPRRWAHDEQVLLQEVAARTSEAIDRARAEDAERESQVRYRQLFDSIDQGFCLIDMIHDADGNPVDYRFIETNAAFVRQTGLEDAVGRTIREFAPAHEPHWFEFYGRIARTGVPEAFEAPASAIGGRWYDVFAFRAGAPELGRVGVLFKDITERRRVAAEKDQLVQQLAEADRRKNEFLATLAHELRNPLAPLTNAAHVIGLAAGDPPRVEAMSRMIERQLRHMVRLVDDLLDISRISRGQITLRRTTFDLAQAVRVAVETSRPLIDTQAHALEIVLPERPVHVLADETRLSQAISNLLNNAAKYTPRGGHLRLEVHLRGDDHVDVVVQDDGVGIPAELLPEMFEMFAQAPGSRGRSQGGLGLGLAIARRMAELHGGTLVARSDGAGTGSTFTLTLPTTAAGVAVEPSPATRTSAVRVLVVDDNRDAADSMASLLRAMGHESRAAYSGAEGLALAREFRPQLALLDIGMPEMDGHQLARAIRAQDWGARMTLAALTGWGQLEDRERSHAAGFDAHVAKPMDGATIQRLLAKVAGPVA